ncbi:MAG: hypothetical protein NVS4B8_03390 [Herpetosiphon sp.]
MNDIIAISLGIVLVTRVLLVVAKKFIPLMYRRWNPTFARWLALLDIAGGVIMLGVLVLLLLRGLWWLAALFALFTVPSLRGMATGFRHLVRLAPKER